MKHFTLGQDENNHALMTYYVSADRFDTSKILSSRAGDGLRFNWCGDVAVRIHVQEEGNYTKMGDVELQQCIFTAKTPIDMIAAFKQCCDEWLALRVLEG